MIKIEKSTSPSGKSYLTVSLNDADDKSTLYIELDTVADEKIEIAGFSESEVEVKS